MRLHRTLKDPMLLLQLALASLLNAVPPSLKHSVSASTATRSGSANMGTLVIGLMVTAITVLVGLVVYYNIWPSLTDLQDTDFTEDANTTITNTEAYFIDAIGLIIIGFIVMGAMVIVSVVANMRGMV